MKNNNNSSLLYIPKRVRRVAYNFRVKIESLLLTAYYRRDAVYENDLSDISLFDLTNILVICKALEEEFLDLNGDLWCFDSAFDSIDCTLKEIPVADYLPKTITHWVDKNLYHKQ